MRRCEHELSETAKTKAHHEMLVEEFKGKIEETKAEIAEKQQAISVHPSTKSTIVLKGGLIPTMPK